MNTDNEKTGNQLLDGEGSDAWTCSVCNNLRMVTSDETNGDVMNTPCPECNEWADASTCSVCILTIDRKHYDITTDDRFMDNGSCIQLLTQNKKPMVRFNSRGGSPVVKTKKALKTICQLEWKDHTHQYGDTVRVFSVLPNS